MSFDVKYCTQRDLQRILPTINDYDQKRKITGWEEEVADSNLWQSGSVGLLEVFYRNGVELDPPKDSKVLCVAEGDWFYDSGIDTVYYYTETDPVTLQIHGGVDWTSLVETVIYSASQMVNSITGKSIFKRPWGVASYDVVIRDGAASLAVAQLVRPFDDELAARIERKYDYDDDDFPKGRLQKVRDGEISLSSETTPALVGGMPYYANVDDASTGGLDDIRGKASQSDTMLLEITTAGTFEYGTASPVKYKIKIKTDAGLQLNEILSDVTINGDYQDLAYGLQHRFHPGDYTLGDKFFVMSSAEDIESIAQETTLGR